MNENPSLFRHHFVLHRGLKEPSMDLRHRRVVIKRRLYETESASST
jgi:hypothetical protein